MKVRSWAITGVDGTDVVQGCGDNAGYTLVLGAECLKLGALALTMFTLL